MTNNQTSLKLSKQDQEKVAYILKTDSGYVVGAEIDYVLFAQTEKQANEVTVKTLSEVKEVIKTIKTYIEKETLNRSAMVQKIKSALDDYKFAVSINNSEYTEEATKDLFKLGVETRKGNIVENAKNTLEMLRQGL